MKWKKFWIILLILLFTPVTTLTMPNPAMQHPGKFRSYKQMMRYYWGIEKHGLKGYMAPIEVDPRGNMFFERDGLKVRL